MTSPRTTGAEPTGTGISSHKVQTILNHLTGNAGVSKAGHRITRVLLFGSRAKGTWREGSDIDIAIEGVDPDRSTLRRWKEEIDDQLFPWVVDLVVVTDDTDRDLRDHIERVGVVLYESP